MILPDDAVVSDQSNRRQTLSLDRGQSLPGCLDTLFLREKVRTGTKRLRDQRGFIRYRLGVSSGGRKRIGEYDLCSYR